MMKVLLQIIGCLTLVSFCIYAQATENDSSKKIIITDNLQRLQIQFDDFEFYRDLNYMKMNLPTIADSNTIWMWTNLSINNSGKPIVNFGSSSSDLISPLYQQFLENSKLNSVYYVLGMAQTAAVGYLAYRHIKKYGLFK